MVQVPTVKDHVRGAWEGAGQPQELRLLLGFSVTRGKKGINFYFIMVPLRKKY